MGPLSSVAVYTMQTLEDVPLQLQTTRLYVGALRTPSSDNARGPLSTQRQHATVDLSHSLAGLATC